MAAGFGSLTFGEASYISPDLDAKGQLVASRATMSLNIWKFPVDGDALGNVSRGVQITRQTGQVQTPSVGASDREVVYLSDSGGHGNLWVVDTTTGVSRQITYEQDPDVVLGVPVWSPDGKQIAYYATRAGLGWNWLVNPDGGNPRQFTEGGWASWSRDGRWLYLNGNTPGVPTGALGPLKKLRPDGGCQRYCPRRQGQSLGDFARRFYPLLRRRAACGQWRHRLRGPCRQPRKRPLAHPCPDPGAADTGLAADPSGHLARRQVAGASVDRWVCHQPLGAADVRRAAAAADGLRSTPHLHRAPRVLVGGRQSDLCRARRRRCRCRAASGVADRTPGSRQP